MSSRVTSIRVPSSRILTSFVVLLLLLASQVQAKNKNKQALPDYVLRAERVLVIIPPDAAEPLNSPMANRNAQDEVERAIEKWGRFHLALNEQDADLIIAVRKGNKAGHVISHSPADDRPVIFQPGDTGARVGGQPGGRPNSMPGGMDQSSQDRGPQMGSQIGSSDDSFEVYRGGVAQPLENSPVWRYTAKDSLNAPQVMAVEQFRKAIEESEKQSQHKP
jgi:hypothetical protein